MALTIAYEGIGVIAQAGGGSYPTDGAGGSWSNVGGGTTAGYNPDAYVQGTESVGCKYPNKDGQVWYSIGTTYNFVNGNAQGQYVYIWMNIQSNGQFDLITANPPGLSITMGSSTNVYRRWAIAGDSNDNGWGSGWKCFVIDPTTSGTSTNGNFNANNISWIGIDINSDTSVRADSIFIDEITIASGIRVTGTTTAGDAWGEIATWAINTPATRRFGFVDIREGIYYVKGRLYVGATTGTTSFEDSGKIIKYETTEYFNGTSWVPSIPNTFAGITLTDGTGTTTFRDGIIVGSDNGRSGSTYIGNENELVNFDASALTNAGSRVQLYGTNFSQFSGGFIGDANTNHAIYGCVFTNMAQVNPSTNAVRNTIFSNTADVDAALLWNDSIDIANCSFIANVTGAAIEIPSGSSTTQTFNSLSFSGNTFDVLNNVGSAISVSNAQGSNATTSEGSAVTFTVSATLTINNLRAESEVRVFRQSDLTELGGIENATTADPDNSGRFKYDYAYTTSEPIFIAVLCLDYQFQRIAYTLDGTDQKLLVSQVTDRQYDRGTTFNPT